MDRRQTDRPVPDVGAHYHRFQRAQKLEEAGRYGAALLEYDIAGAHQHAAKLRELVGLSHVLGLDPASLP